jgi:hypothetical protein
MRSNQSASDEPQSFHESSKHPCRNANFWSVCQEQVHTHCPESTNHAGPGKGNGIGNKCSKVEGKIEFDKTTIGK